MRNLASLSVCLLVACLPLRGEVQAQPNTLTPKEVADGWLLLFDGQSKFGWSAVDDCQVEQGSLLLAGAKNLTLENNTRFGSFHFRFDYQWTGEHEPLLI